MINKGAIVPASYGKKNETILKILTLRIFLTTRCSTKLRKLCSQTQVLTESITFVKDDFFREISQIYSKFFYSNIVKKINISLDQKILIF